MQAFWDLVVQRFLFFVERQGSVELIYRYHVFSASGRKGYFRRVYRLVEIVFAYAQIFSSCWAGGIQIWNGISCRFGSKGMVIMCLETVILLRHSRGKGDSQMRVIVWWMCCVFKAVRPYWLSFCISALTFKESGPIRTLFILTLRLQQIGQSALQLTLKLGLH